MSIFGQIMTAIFGEPENTKQDNVTVTTAGQPASSPTVDVEAILSGMAEQKTEKLDWRHSIVDLMKLLGLDSDLSARKQLAQELGYNDDMNDSAKMNIWLHAQVMKKLAENGGKVSDALKNQQAA
ncbi:MAG: DUF3597 domain-containing protein [Pseudomonadota bacterium]